MTRFKTQTVAQFLTDCIDSQTKTQKQIATEIGYKNANIITMLKHGETKLPLDKIGPIAKALEIDCELLFYMVLKEYIPETFVALKPFMQALSLSDEERLLINAFRCR